ncbi:MAG: alpha/beta hydrolase [Burkholderiales bacterium]
MNNAFAKKDVEFLSHGTLCRGWLFAPAAADAMRCPCIIMAHGLGGTIDCGLESFAEHFAQNGFVVLVFDYRCFGSSEGSPRQLLHIGKQIEDWQAAFEFSRSLPMVDPQKVGLWGTSFSSGHVLHLAAKDERIAAVCAQNPMVDGLAAALALADYAGMLKLAQLALYGMIDQIGAWLGLNPLTIPIVAKEGTLAGLSTKGALEMYLSIVGPTWVNRMTTRMAVTLMTYRPILSAKKVRCPTLLQAGIIDNVTPPADAVKFAEKAGSNVMLKQYNMGHFDFYTGENQQHILKDQTDFFRRALSQR